MEEEEEDNVHQRDRRVRSDAVGVVHSTTLMEPGIACFVGVTKLKDPILIHYYCIDE